MNPITPQPQSSRFHRFWHFTKERPWAMSLCIHGVFFSLLCVSAIISWFNFPKVVHVFTLVDTSMMEAAQGQPGPKLANDKKAAAIAAAMQEEDFDDFLHEPVPAKKEKVKQAEVKPVEPKPEPKKVEKKPESKVEKVVKKDDLTIADKKKSETKKEPEVKKMSYEDFIKQNPKLDPKAKKDKDVKTKDKAPSKTSSEAVQKEIRQQLEKLKSEIKSISARSTISAVGGSASVSSSVGGGGGGSTMMLSAMERYLSSLKTAIDRAWKKPESVNSKNAEATVEFQIDASGRLGQVKLLKKSGDKAFDDSVLAAFDALGKSIAPAGTPPSKENGSFRLTFQVE